MNIQVRIPEFTANLLNKPELIEFTAEECLPPHIIENSTDAQYRSEILTDVELFLHLDVGTLSQHSISKIGGKIIISDKITS